MEFLCIWFSICDCRITGLPTLPTCSPSLGTKELHVEISVIEDKNQIGLLDINMLWSKGQYRNKNFHSGVPIQRLYHIFCSYINTHTHTQTTSKVSSNFLVLETLHFQLSNIGGTVLGRDSSKSARVLCKKNASNATRDCDCDGRSIHSVLI